MCNMLHAACGSEIATGDQTNTSRLSNQSTYEGMKDKKIPIRKRNEIKKDKKWQEGESTKTKKKKMKKGI